MDYSLLSAGRAIHFKIVTVALVCAVGVVLIGINARAVGIEASGIRNQSAVVTAGPHTALSLTPLEN